MIDVARTIRSSLTRVAPLVALTIVSLPHTGSAQTATKKVLSVDDYTKWKSIGNSVDLGRRQVGDVRVVGDEHGAGRREARAAPRPARQ